MNSLGCGKRSNALSNLQNQVLAEGVVGLIAVLDGNKSGNGLTSKLVCNTNDSSLGNGVVLDQGGFDFGGGETVTGNVDDIIDTATDPVVALVITGGTIASELGFLLSACTTALSVLQPLT